jgi:hypothetical protein
MLTSVRCEWRLFRGRRFNWISHTWTHQNLDWLEGSECGGNRDTCRPTYERILAELTLNIRLAEGVKIKKSDYISAFRKMGFRPTPSKQMFGYPGNEDLAALHWSPTCLVTPEISGLWPASVPTLRGANQNGHVPNPKNAVSLQVRYGTVWHGHQGRADAVCTARRLSTTRASAR